MKGSGDPIAEPGVGVDGGKSIAFTIDAVFEHQKPSDQAPFHVADGDWTFFDAHTVGGAHFGFGMQGKPSDEVAFGKGLWTVPDHAAGVQLTQEFAKVFGGKLPPEEPAQPLAPKPIALALLGGASGRRSNGFSGTGVWQPAKLFLQRPGIEAEVFFNVNVSEKRGEFSEKDSDYADDMLRYMARELRDGPQPLPTPETDPRISREGPKLGEFRALGPRDARFLGFDPAGQHLLYAVSDGGGAKVYLASSSGDAPDTELFHTVHAVQNVDCDARQELCVVEQVVHERANVFSPDDPVTLWLYRRPAPELVALSGPWGDDGSKPTSSISPDGKWLAIGSRQKRSSGRGKYQIIHFVSASALDQAKTVRNDETWLDVVAWRGSGAKTQAILRLGFSFDTPPAPLALYDLARAEQTQLPEPPPEVADGKISPDGKLAYSCQGDSAIVITELSRKNTRSFAVSPRERHALSEGCDLSWRGSRYLEFSPERTGFIDVTSLKLSFLTPGNEDDPEGLEYDPTFSFALDTHDKQLRVAPITVH